VASNSTALVRSGVLTVAGQTFAITQAGAPCTYWDIADQSSPRGSAGRERACDCDLAHRVQLDGEQQQWLDYVTSGHQRTGSANMTYT